MADDVLEDAGPSPDAGKVKREPPTIDLEATKVSEAAKTSETASDKPADAPTGPSQTEPPKDRSNSADESRRPISPWLTAPVSGVIGAAIVIAVSWLAGWPSQQTPPAAPQVGVMAFEELGMNLHAGVMRLSHALISRDAAARRDAEQSLLEIGVANSAGMLRLWVPGVEQALRRL